MTRSVPGWDDAKDNMLGLDYFYLLDNLNDNTITIWIYNFSKLNQISNTDQ